MNDENTKKRRYTEEEFALILRKASEIQEAPKSQGGHGVTGGFTLEEIQSIAAEAGIDPQAITRAAAILGAREWNEKKGLVDFVFGEASKFHLDLEVPGRVPPEEMGRILEDIRRAAEHQGEAKEVLGGVEWKTVGEVSAINVNISPRGDRTSIQIVGNRDGAGALSFTFPVAGGFILMGALGAAIEPSTAAGIAALIASTVGGGFLLGRTIFVRGSRRFRQRLTRLMDVLSSSVERGALPPGSSPDEPTDSSP